MRDLLAQPGAYLAYVGQPDHRLVRARHGDSAPRHARQSLVPAPKRMRRVVLDRAEIGDRLVQGGGNVATACFLHQMTAPDVLADLLGGELGPRTPHEAPIGGASRPRPPPEPPCPRRPPRRRGREVAGVLVHVPYPGP